MTEHGPIDVKSKTGEESFTENGQKLNFDLKSFWRWSMSDLVSNTTRGVLAEKTSAMIDIVPWRKCVEN